jgi:aldose 1-epimerase
MNLQDRKMRFDITHQERNGWLEVRLEDALSEVHALVIPSAGAILNGFGIQREGPRLEVVDGFSGADDFRARIEKGFQSAKLSPYVCRIRNATYEWRGRSYRIGRFLLGDSAIHGLIYDRPFEVMEESVHADHCEILLKHAYHATDPGYPFPLDCHVRYRLEQDGNLTVTTAVHNRSEETIPVADGWHPYFTLGDSVDELTLQIATSERLEYDPSLIPTGRTIPDTSWREPKRIGDIALDHGYVLDFSGQGPLCTLSNPATGAFVSFHPEPSYPYLQLYIPEHRRSIAIENLSAAPDAFNNGMGLVALEPDRTRTFSTRFRVGLA